jgi:glutathione peroxidase-family protein
MLFSFVSFNSQSVSRLLVGQKFPEMELLEENNGELILINFWAAYDAASRDENVQFSSLMKKIKGSKPSFKSISVSMDKYESIFEEVVKQDNLDFSEIKREPKGFESKLAKDLKLNKNFGNFLVNSQGRIIAKDLSPDELQQILSKY